MPKAIRIRPEAFAAHSGHVQDGGWADTLFGEAMYQENLYDNEMMWKATVILA